MAIKSKDKKEWMEWHAKKMMMLGALLFIVGLLRNMGYDWSVVLMIIGALIFVKGLIKKMM